MTVQTREDIADHTPGPGRVRVVLGRVVRYGWFLLLAVGLAFALRDRWAEVRDQLAMIDPPMLAVAAMAGLAGVGASSGIWHQMLLAVGADLPLRTSLRIFYVGQVGKYLPGAVWPAVTQAALAREHGVAPRASVTAVTLFLWIHLVTGGGIAVAVLASTGQLPAAALLAVPIAVFLLVPSVLGWCLQTALRMLRRRPLEQVPNGHRIAAAVGWAAVMWTLYGVHVQVLTAAVDDPISPILGTGVFAASWVVGFVLVIAPAGAGPREAAMVALLPLVSTPGLLVALVSRLVLTVADAVWAVVTAIAGDRHTSRQR